MTLTQCVTPDVHLNTDDSSRGVLMRISQLRHKASCVSNMNFSAGKMLGCIFPQIIFTEASKALRILLVFRSVDSSVQYSSTDGCSVGLNDLSVLICESLSLLNNQISNTVDICTKPVMSCQHHLFTSHSESTCVLQTRQTGLMLGRRSLGKVY